MRRGFAREAPTRADTVGERDAVAAIAAEEQSGRSAFRRRHRFLESRVDRRVLRDRPRPPLHAEKHRLTARSQQPPELLRHQPVQAGVVGPVCNTTSDDVVVWRVTSAEASHEPKSMDEVKDAVFGEDFKETVPYANNKVARYYVAETRTAEITLPVSPELGHPEHDEWRWVTCEEAEEFLPPRLTHVLDWLREKINE